MKYLLTSAACIALLTGCATAPTDSSVVLGSGSGPGAYTVPVAPEPSGPPVAAKPTPEEARAFVDDAEKKLADLAEYDAHVQWVGATFINYDTEWLQTRADAALNEATVKYAMESAQYNDVDADPVTRRKLNLLRISQTLPAAAEPGAAEELSAVAAKLGSTYSTGKFDWKGKTYNLDDASDVMARTRDPATTRAMWEGWMSIAAPMKEDYAKLAALSNKGAQGLGFKDTGALWRSGYDMDPDAFAAETDKLWNQVAPFYKNLHCYTRRKLNEKYGDAVQPKTGPIRADLLGNMWAQDWSNIYDVVAPKGIKSSYSLDKLLVKKKYDPLKMVHTGENFYTSLGFRGLPETFWERSQFTRPRDREVVCHASAWDVDNVDDLRIKMCTKVNGEDFYTVHHELGHNFYQRAYADQPFLFKNGANDGFHEAIGDFVGLSSVTPTYLKQIGLLDKVPGNPRIFPTCSRWPCRRWPSCRSGWKSTAGAGRSSPVRSPRRSIISAGGNWCASIRVLRRRGRGPSPPSIRAASIMWRPACPIRVISWPISCNSSSSARPANRPAGRGRCTAVRSMASARWAKS